MSLGDELVARSLAGRQEQVEAEMGRLIDATYTVIARRGRIDPSVRAILAEANMSNQAFYRHFRSKDELLLLMLDEGRRALASYLAHRMDGLDDPIERVAEWVRGVLAQAADPDAATRTRPFVVDVERLHQLFPAQQQASEQHLIEQLAEALTAKASHWAQPVYLVTFGSLEQHLRTESAPTRDEVEQLVRFVQAGIRADE